MPFSVSANAMDLSREFRPYIGLDYVYSHADYKDMVREPKKSYNSGAVNVGTWITPYASLEAFFQQSAKTKAYKGTEYRVRTEFYACVMNYRHSVWRYSISARSQRSKNWPPESCRSVTEKRHGSSMRRL